MRASVKTLISQSPSSRGTKDLLLRLADDFSALEMGSRSRQLLARERLNELLNTLTRNGGGQKASLVACSIYIVKRLAKGHLDDGSLDDHPVTDHAFCAAIRRLGYDIATLKDKAQEEAHERGLRPVKKGNIIVTFLPQVTDHV